MKRLLMITSAVGLCLAAPAFAQTTTDQEQLNKQRTNQPAASAPANQTAPAASSGTQQQPSQSGQAQNQQQPSSNNAQAPSQSQSGQAQNQQKPAASNPPASSAQAPNNQNQSGQAQSQQKPAGNTTNAQTPADKQQQRSATDRNQPTQSNQAQQNNQQQNAQGDRTRSGQSQRDSARSQNRNTDRSSASLNVNINDQQRTRISAAITSTNVRPVNVNFRIATGIAVPRSVALHTLPSSIIEIVPQYRGYNYFVTREQIVIVEPRRKTIVAVMPAGGTARAQGPASSSNRVSFTDQQRDVIRSRSSSMRSRATTGSGSSLIAVEQEVPTTIELEEFPAEIVTEVPTVRGYRYFRQDNDVVVVDPTQRRVIEIIR